MLATLKLDICLVHLYSIMDSVRINLQEEQSPQKKDTPKQAIFPLIILFALIITGIILVSIAIVIQHFSQNSHTYIGPTDPQYIKGIYSFTPYKSLCCSALFVLCLRRHDEYLR